MKNVDIVQYERKICVVDKTGQSLFCIEGDDEKEMKTALRDYGRDIVEHLLRNAIRAELDAINQYEMLKLVLEEMGAESAARIVSHIIDEEREHFGEFKKILEVVSPKEGIKYRAGEEEATRMLVE